MDVIVIGAGLIGLASAYELALRGAQVHVFDIREPGGAASWAGAGILSPYSEPIASPELAAFCAASLASYPTFVEGLRERCEIDPRLRIDGNLQVVYAQSDLPRLEKRAEELRSRGLRAHCLDRDQIRELEPALGSEVAGGLLVEDEGRIDNRLLSDALRAVCSALGVRITADTAAKAVEADERRVRGVQTSRGFAASPIVLNAAGAWAGVLGGVPESARIPVEPIKGQMLALETVPDFVQRVVWFPTEAHGYAVPRDDGRLLIGATVERACFDVRVTAAGMHELLGAALRAMPSLGTCSVLQTWAGVRPGSPDGVPYIGGTEVEGYFTAAGHFRYGILLTPASARLIADVIEGRELPAYASAFSPRRMRLPTHREVSV